MPTSATPATQNQGRCLQVPRLPRETKVDVAKYHACHTKRWCKRWCMTTLCVPRLRRKTNPPSSCVAAAALCLAGVAQRNSHRRFAWQVWHLETFICYLRGRCGTWRHPTACHLRGRRALGDIHFGFASQAWHTRRCHTPSFCVAGVALGDIHLRFAWQVWHLVTSTCCLYGSARHHALSFADNCVTHTHTTCHTPSLAQCMRLAFCVQTITFHFVTHNCFNFSILHHLLCLSFLPRPRYNL